MVVAQATANLKIARDRLKAADARVHGTAGARLESNPLFEEQEEEE